MAKQYFQYTKKHFEYELKGILIKNKLGYMSDITEQWRREGKDMWENIFNINKK